MAHNLDAPAQPAFLQRPLYVFDLPEELLFSLELKTELNGNDAPAIADTDGVTNGTEVTSASSERAETPDGSPASATSCALCGMSFANVQEQRSHARSDIHGYNVKQKMRGLKTVNEVDFDRLIGDLDESISGSDSDESDSSDDDKRKDTTLSALLRKQATLADPSFENSDDFSSKKRKRGSGKAPQIWFTSPLLPPNTNLGVYRTLFTLEEQAMDAAGLVRLLQQKQLSPKPAPPPPQRTSTTKRENGEDTGGGVPLPKEPQPNTSATGATGPHYFLCMIGGGHFAAMIVSLTPKVTKNHTSGTDRAATVIAHKTFHRYTTRRKQGGSQSAADNTKSIHSAGSSLRRYNEAALTQEVRDLLREWKPWIDTSELLFIRASGTTNRRTLFGPYDGQVLSTNDSRNRGFPFNTRRATQAELMRAFVELTRVKVSIVDQEALRKAAAEEEAQRQKDQAAAEAKAAKAAEKAQATKKRSQEEEEAALHTQQLQSLLRRSKAPALASYLTTNSLDPNFVFYPPNAPANFHAPTPLHLAASLNAPACVSALLVKGGADPTVRSGEGKTAFEIAGDRATRDAFRLARSELGEAKWSWDSANIPSALSKADAEKRAAREKEEQSAADSEEKARRTMELERLRKEERDREEGRKEKKFGKGKSLGVPEKTAQEKREEEARGMTPEMRMKLERERRARAAEARFQR